MSEALSYPIGRFDPTAPFPPDRRSAAIEVFATLPDDLRRAVAGLTEAQLDAQYRSYGWTVRQLVHHIADSHMNGYIRLKLAITEDQPTIKPYDQNLWATLPDSAMPIDVSIGIVDGVHRRWVTLWRSLSPEQFSRAFVHPEMGPLTVNTHLHLYAWHSRHHVAHITNLRSRNGW
jgi:hypothetical protein